MTQLILLAYTCSYQSAENVKAMGHKQLWTVPREVAFNKGVKMQENSDIKLF